MQTNIEIDDDLIAEAMAVTGLPTKKAAVEEALRRVTARNRQRKACADLAGIGWDGDLNVMRNDGSQSISEIFGSDLPNEAFEGVFDQPRTRIWREADS